MQGQETYSYYGPLNALTYNVGYHNEHHDFPQIPHSKLYRLREIAPEYYNTLAWHTSWCWIVWTFLTDPKVSLACPASLSVGGKRTSADSRTPPAFNSNDL